MSAFDDGSMEQTRRDFVRRAAAVGALAVPGVSAISSCAVGGGGGGGTEQVKGAVSATNPLGVKKTAPLEVIIFNGGYGDKYAEYHVKMYEKRYPKANAKMSSTQQIQQTLQPRFVAGNPPDVIDNAGGHNMDTAGLVSQGQVADLSDLLKAPSLDIKGKTVEETLLPGVVKTGSFDGTPRILNYVYQIWGFWHSQPLFEKQGWEEPKTWDEMMSLCAKIKKTTDMAPFTYTGVYPYYIYEPLLTMAAKNGGEEVLVNIDNLEPNAWKQDSVIAAAEALHELRAKDYILSGSKALTHTESQTAWVKGKAAFIPVGSWVENEMKSVTPDGFDMVVQPTPSLSSSDALPYETIHAKADEPFLVPSQAKNVRGGMEYLRIMLSKQGGRKFAELTHALPVVEGAAEGLEASTALASVREASKAAGQHRVQWLFRSWYAKLDEAVQDATGAMMAGEIGVDKWAQRCQKAADRTAKDDSIKKYHRS